MPAIWTGHYFAPDLKRGRDTRLSTRLCLRFCRFLADIVGGGRESGPHADRLIKEMPAASLACDESDDTAGGGSVINFAEIEHVPLLDLNPRTASRQSNHSARQNQMNCSAPHHSAPCGLCWGYSPDRIPDRNSPDSWLGGECCRGWPGCR